jgi:hypothetical protein
MQDVSLNEAAAAMQVQMQTQIICMTAMFRLTIRIAHLGMDLRTFETKTKLSKSKIGGEL